MINSRTSLKTTFQTGDRPTQQQFENWMDSYVHMTEVNSGTITISGTISATTGSFGYLDITGTTAFDAITVGGGYGNTGLTISNGGVLTTNGIISSDVSITAGTSFIIGNANIDEVDLLKIDGIIDGNGLPNKALILNVSRSISNINSITAASASFSILSGSSGYIKNVDIDNSAIGFGGASSASFTTIHSSGDISSSNGTLFANEGYFANNVRFGQATVIISGSSGQITASGNISSSKGILGHTFIAKDAYMFTDLGGGISEANNNIIIGASTWVEGDLTASGDISASGGTNIIGNDVIIGEDCDSSLQIRANITASCNISASGTGSFGYIVGDGSGLTNLDNTKQHGNSPSITGSITVNYNSNQTLVTNNTGEFTIPLDSEYTIQPGAQIDLQYTPIAERLYRYDVDTGNFIPYAQANIDSETTLMKGFGAATAGVGNDSTIRHNATVPENFVTILHTTTNVTQSEDPNNNPMTTDPHSITIQDQSTYTIKSGADVTVDGVHHGVVRKDIALFKTMGIGDTQAIGPSGSNSFNDQYNNIYPSASAHLHISASNPVVKIEAASGIGLLSIDGNISASGGTITALSGSYSELSGNSPLTINGETIFNGLITSLGNISSSNSIYADKYFKNGVGLFNSPSFSGDVTASGNISSSGTVYANQYYSDGHPIVKNQLSGTGNIAYLGFSNITDGVQIGKLNQSKGINITGHITASSNISASGNITGVTGSFEGGLVLTSPNGTKYRFTTNDSGHLSITGSTV
mgnify:CR=1 FL=1